MLPFPKKKLVNNIEDQKELVRAGIKSMKTAQDLHLDVPKQELIPNTQYSDRILDAVARIFHVTSVPCTAVCIVQDTLYVAYSVTGKNITKVYPEAKEQANKIHKFLEFTINSNGHYTAFRDHLLYITHKFYCNKEIFENNQKDYCVDIEECLKVENLGLKKEVQDFLNLKNNLSNIDSYYDSLVRNLNNAELDVHILNTVTNYIDSAKSKMVYLNNRIDQDCYKVMKFYSEYGIGQLKLEFVPDISNLHAELNLRQKFGVDSGYIGISKLSCFFCDIFLRHEEELYGRKLHLGGHGIAFPMQNNDLPEMLFDEVHKPVISKMFLQVSRAYEGMESLCYSVDNVMQYPPLSPRNEGLYDPWDPNVPVVAEDYSLTALGDTAEANGIIS